jgi:hypothetical protein
MNNDDRKLLVEIHGDVRAIKAELGHKASKEDLRRVLSEHIDADHRQPRRRVTNVRGKLYAVLITLAAAAAAALTTYAAQ